MNTRTRDGSTVRDQLLVVQKNTGITPAELQNEPELDDIFHEPWSWFLRLHNKRQQSFGISPIGFSEIKAFFELLQYTPSAWELEILEFIDTTAVEEISRQQEKQQKEKPKTK